VDVLRTSHILGQKKIHGDKVLAYVTPQVEEVDTLADFDYLEYRVSQRQEVVDRLFKQYV
jgi:hypothetical protein